MTTRKRSEAVLRALCAQTYEDDGAGASQPRRKEDGRDKKITRKDLQLCKQVLRAVNDGLQMAVGDPLLHELAAVRATPDPDPTRLRVEIEPSAHAERCGAAAIMRALDRARGFLRAQAAAAITRKRAPVLTFALVAREEALHEE